MLPAFRCDGQVSLYLLPYNTQSVINNNHAPDAYSYGQLFIDRYCGNEMPLYSFLKVWNHDIMLVCVCKEILCKKKKTFFDFKTVNITTGSCVSSFYHFCFILGVKLMNGISD